MCGVHARIREADFAGVDVAVTPAVPRDGDDAIPGAETVPADLLEAFTAYERAIMANDLDVLDAAFAPGAGTMRGDAAGLLVGHDAISAFRGVRGGVPPRVIERIEHRALGPDAALLVSVSRFAGGGTGLQTQVWERIDGRWLITAAHVTPRAQALDRSVWRTVGDPLWQGAWEGRARRPHGRRQGSVRDQGLPHRRGQPGIPRRGARRDHDRGRGERPAARRSVAARHRPHRRVRVQHRRRQRALRHPAQRCAPGRAARRIVERSGIRRRHRPGRDRPRDRHRGVGAGARVVPGTVGAAHDARPRSAAGPAAARAVLRHDRLAHPRRRDAAARRRLVPQLRRVGVDRERATASRTPTCRGASSCPTEVLAAVEPDTRAAFDALLLAAGGIRRMPPTGRVASRSAISTTTSCRSAPCRAPRRGATTANGSARTRMPSAPPWPSGSGSPSEVDRRGRGIRSPRARAARRARARPRGRRRAAHAHRARAGADAHRRRRARERRAQSRRCG